MAHYNVPTTTDNTTLMAHYNTTTDNGQHWTTVRELLMRKDKEQCESWKDEVQNILIFSGLFSAIVTAFLIESQKDLQPHPAHISIWINVFWFLSLVLSVTTALVGIVSLQWIRTHMRSLNDGPESLGLSHMHSVGLHQSNIRHVFTSLSLLLIFGLTFFLIGIIVFLFNLSRPVAIVTTTAIACTFLFLLVTTALPASQCLPVKRPSDVPACFPSLYRSPQSRLFLHQRDWELRSKIWLRQRTEDFFDNKKVLSHLEPIPGLVEPPPFAYDTIQALKSVKESQSAESEKERTALAKCLAEVLPIHLDLFPTEDLADLIPFLSPTNYVPSSIFLHHDSATREERSALALLAIATRIGQPSQSAPLVDACVRTTHWLFERPHTLDSVPNKQPLHLISKPNEVASNALEALIDSLTRFFAFATDFQPKSQLLHKTTHTSSYTYWFLHLSANILIKCKLSEELRARHAYILHMIIVHLGKKEANDYLFHTASIYASTISTSSAMSSSPFWGDFLRAVNNRRADFLRDDRLQLRKALKADEVVWHNINQALEAFGCSDDASMSDCHGANDAIVAHRPLSRTHGQDYHALSEAMESGTQIGDVDSVRMAAQSDTTTCHTSAEKTCSFRAGPMLEVARVNEREKPLSL